jgi:hypothetical protein
VWSGSGRAQSYKGGGREALVRPVPRSRRRKQIDDAYSTLCNRFFDFLEAHEGASNGVDRSLPGLKQAPERFSLPWRLLATVPRLPRAVPNGASSLLSKRRHQCGKAADGVTSMAIHAGCPSTLLTSAVGMAAVML